MLRPPRQNFGLVKGLTLALFNITESSCLYHKQPKTGVLCTWVTWPTSIPYTVSQILVYILLIWQPFLMQQLNCLAWCAADALSWKTNIAPYRVPPGPWKYLNGILNLKPANSRPWKSSKRKVVECDLFL